LKRIRLAVNRQSKPETNDDNDNNNKSKHIQISYIYPHFLVGNIIAAAVTTSSSSSFSVASAGKTVPIEPNRKKRKERIENKNRQVRQMICNRFKEALRSSTENDGSIDRLRSREIK